jgi:hypothetical protein
MIRLLPLFFALACASSFAAETCPAEATARGERGKATQASAEHSEAESEGAPVAGSARARGGPPPPPARARWHRTLPGMFK